MQLTCHRFTISPILTEVNSEILAEALEYVAQLIHCCHKVHTHVISILNVMKNKILFCSMHWKITEYYLTISTHSKKIKTFPIENFLFELSTFGRDTIRYYNVHRTLVSSAYNFYGNFVRNLGCSHRKINWSLIELSNTSEIMKRFRKPSKRGNHSSNPYIYI